MMIGQGGAAGGPDGVWRHGRPTGASARGRILQGWHEPWQGGRASHPIFSPIGSGYLPEIFNGLCGLHVGFAGTSLMMLIE